MLGLKPKVSFDEFEISSEEELDFAFINIAPFTEIFEVVAQDHPENVLNNNYNIIGRIQILSPIANSVFGDSKLFFKHQQFEEDLAINKHWIENMNEFDELYCGRKCTDLNTNAKYT